MAPVKISSLKFSKFNVIRDSFVINLILKWISLCPFWIGTEMDSLFQLVPLVVALIV